MCGARPSVTAWRTVIPSGTGARCGMNARSRASSAAARIARSSSPRQRTLPPAMSCSPETARTSVDLPAPLGPTTATSRPASSDRSAPCRIGVPPIRTWTSRASSSGPIRPPCAAATGTAAPRARPSADRPAARAGPARCAPTCRRRAAARRRARADAGTTKPWRRPAGQPHDVRDDQPEERPAARPAPPPTRPAARPRPPAASRITPRARRRATPRRRRPARAGRAGGSAAIAEHEARPRSTATRPRAGVQPLDVSPPASQKTADCTRSGIRRP